MMKVKARECAVRGRRLAAALLLAGALWPLAGVAEARITFNMKEADLETVVATVADITGKNFIVDPRVKGKVTVISSRPMSEAEVYQTFLSLLEVHGFATVATGNVIKIVPDVNAKQSPGAVVDSAAAGRGDEVVTQVIEVKHVSAAQLMPILRPLVPQQGHMAAYPNTNVLIISDRAANVARLVKIIERIDVASASDIELIALKHASASEVVRTLETLQRGAKAGDAGAGAGLPVLVADERTNSILISGDKSERVNLRALIGHLDTPLETTGNTQVIYLRYAKAKDLVPVLTGLSQSYEQEQKGGAKAPAAAPVAGGAAAGRIPINLQAHEATNALVLTAPPDLMASMQEVIRKLDVRRAQVVVEAVIAEISNTRAAELGVQWLFDGRPGGNGPVGGTNFGSSNVASIAAAIQAGTAPPISPGLLFGLGRFNSNDINFGALINALEGDGASNVLSKPTVVTLDNEEAEIVIGQNVPFVTGSFTNTGGGTTPSNPFQTIKRENVGITLKVKPQINEGDAVKLDIEQKVDSLAASSVGAADLITNTRSIRTSVLIDDGGVIVLGGLITDDLKESEQKVPVLGDLPVIGALFRYKKTNKDKTNLMVFLHPRILRDAALTTRVTAGKYDFIRARQMEVREQGVALMGDKEAPVLPTLPELTTLPPAGGPAPVVEGVPAPAAPPVTTPPAAP